MMKNISKIALIILVTFSLVGCGDSEARMSALEMAKNDEKNPSELGSVIEEKGYEFYESNSEGFKYSYLKNEGDKVQLSYTEQEVYESVFIFTKDYSTDVTVVNFILTRTTKDSKFVYSIYPEEENTILVDKEIYKDCSVDTCVTEGKAEITFEHYLYDVENNELRALDDGEMNIKLKDVSDDLEIYFEELKSIYGVDE